MLFGRVVAIVVVALVLWFGTKLFLKAWRKANVKEKLEGLETEREIAKLVKSVREKNVQKAREIIDNFENITKEK